MLRRHAAPWMRECADRALRPPRRRGQRAGRADPPRAAAHRSGRVMPRTGRIRRCVRAGCASSSKNILKSFPPSSGGTTRYVAGRNKSTTTRVVGTAAGRRHVDGGHGAAAHHDVGRRLRANVRKFEHDARRAVAERRDRLDDQLAVAGERDAGRAVGAPVPRDGSRASWRNRDSTRGVRGRRRRRRCRPCRAGTRCRNRRKSCCACCAPDAPPAASAGSARAPCRAPSAPLACSMAAPDHDPCAASSALRARARVHLAQIDEAASSDRAGW